MCKILAAFLLAGLGSATLPNVVVVLTDDVGWGDVGYNCANKTVCPNTPRIDALATGDSAVLFHRFYSGAGVCSPTRASVLTGRNNYRGCIKSALPCDHMATGAAGCTQGPGLAHAEFTIAKAAAKVKIPSIHIGKWHLGDLWNKNGKTPPVVSSPGDHGFTEWFTSQSQLPTSTPNCGCFPPVDWKPPNPLPDFGKSSAGLKFKHTYPGENCVLGGGFFTNESDVCSTYWYPNSSSPTGVSPISKKIPGDDGEFVVETLETFVKQSIAQKTPFLAALWMHYIHLPHPAMPKYFAQYKYDGDYVGTLQQLDDNIGAIEDMLKKHEVWDNTILWFTSDNGPHCIETSKSWPEVHCGGIHVGRSSGGQGVTKGVGLRGCKASNWEGGIRTPGFMTWPARIKKNVVTWVPAVTHDILPTLMEAYGVESDHPDWPLDGSSLMPFINAASGEPNAIDTLPTRREKPIGFWWGGSKAWIDNDMKIVAGSISSGQGCPIDPPYNKQGVKGPYLYNLTADQTESVDLSKSMPALYAQMNAEFELWQGSVANSSEINQCGSGPKPPTAPTPSPAPPGPAGTNCTFSKDIGGFGGDARKIHGLTLQACCDECLKDTKCTVAVFEGTANAQGLCHIKNETKPGYTKKGFWACRARNLTSLDYLD